MTLSSTSSKSPASAIVKPEPKRETRKVWFNVYECEEGRQPGISTPKLTRKQADEWKSDRRIACIEREIEFVHGEGLDKDH